MKILEARDIPVDVSEVPIDNPMEVFKVCLRMQEVCRQANGLGLSAVQVGIPWRLFIVSSNGLFAEHKHHRSMKNEYRYFANCKYTPIGENKTYTLEGCLSLPGRRFRVSRWAEVLVEGLELKVGRNPKFVPLSLKFVSDPSGYAGTVLQHEIDHQDGITIDQHGKELDVHRTRFW